MSFTPSIPGISANSRIPGLAAAGLSAVTFGLLGLFTRHLYDSGLSVASTLTWRFVIAAIVLGLVTPIFGDPGIKPTVRDRCLNTVFGAVGYGISALLFFVAMQRTTTGLANLLLFQNPFVVFCLTALKRRSAPDFFQILAIAGTVVGTIFVCTPGELKIEPLGIAAGVASALTYGTYLFASEARFIRFDSYWVTLDVLTGSALAFVLCTVASGSLELPADGQTWGLALIQAVLCTVIPVLALLYAIKALGVRNATIISALEPAVTLAVGAMWLSEPCGWSQAAGGGILIVSVLYLSLRRGGSPDNSQDSSHSTVLSVQEHVC